MRLRGAQDQANQDLTGDGPKPTNRRLLQVLPWLAREIRTAGNQIRIFAGCVWLRHSSVNCAGPGRSDGSRYG